MLKCQSFKEKLKQVQSTVLSHKDKGEILTYSNLKIKCTNENYFTDDEVAKLKHEDFLKILKDNKTYFTPKESKEEHIKMLSNESYLKCCGIAWLETQNSDFFAFTKREAYEAIGLAKATKELDVFWRILTRKMNSAYVCYDIEMKKWIWL